MKLLIDKFEASSIDGWAVDENDPDTELIIYLILNGELIASTIANKYRKDLERVKVRSGNLSYSIDTPKINNWPCLTLIAENPRTGKRSEEISPRKLIEQTKISNLKEKNEKFKILEPLLRIGKIDFSEKSVLEINPNQNYLSLLAKIKQANYTETIDHTHDIYQHINNIAGTYDIAFVINEHNEIPDIEEALGLVKKKIHSNSKLIIFTVVAEDASSRLHSYQLAESTLIPTKNYLINHVLKEFATTIMMERKHPTLNACNHISIHATPKKPTIILIEGQSGAGKSNLAQQIQAMGATSISIDGMLHDLKRRYSNYPAHSIEYILGTEIDLLQIDTCLNNLISRGLAQEISAWIANSLPRRFELLCIEGYALSVPSLASTLHEMLSSRDCKIWRMECIK